MSSVTFFKTPLEFRNWLDNNYNKESVLWVGFYKKASKIQSITLPEAVQQALCFGWIDGLINSIDDISYKIRFTPRRKNSKWSKVNVNYMDKLIKEGKVHSSGIEAFSHCNRDKAYSVSEQCKSIELTKEYKMKLESNENGAMDYFETLSKSVQKKSIFWIMSAKRKSTQERRLQVLIESSENNQVIPPLQTRTKLKKE